MFGTHLIEQFYFVELLTIMATAVFAISYTSKLKTGEKSPDPLQKTKTSSPKCENKKYRLWPRTKKKRDSNASTENIINVDNEVSPGEEVTKTVCYIPCFQLYYEHSDT